MVYRAQDLRPVSPALLLPALFRGISRIISLSTLLSPHTTTFPVGTSAAEVMDRVGVHQPIDRFNEKWKGMVYFPQTVLQISDLIVVSLLQPKFLLLRV